MILNLTTLCTVLYNEENWSATQTLWFNNILVMLLPSQGVVVLRVFTSTRNKWGSEKGYIFHNQTVTVETLVRPGLRILN